LSATDGERLVGVGVVSDVFRNELMAWNLSKSFYYFGLVQVPPLGQTLDKLLPFSLEHPDQNNICSFELKEFGGMKR